MTTIGEFLSRLRRNVKAVSQDAFLTDRFLYSITIRHVSWLLKREDSTNKLLKQDSIIQVLPFVELIDVDRIDAGCYGVYSNCTFKRTKEQIPELFDGYSSPLIRAVTSLDGSQELEPTDPTIFLNITNQSSYRFNKTKYYWFLNQHLYFPELEWDGIRIEGIFKGDVSDYGCNDCNQCRPRQEQVFNVPAYLFGELESHILKDLRDMMGIPQDSNQDKQSITR